MIEPRRTRFERPSQDHHLTAMLLRQFPRICHSLPKSETRSALPTRLSKATNQRISLRKAHTPSTIADPDLLSDASSSSRSISLADPRESTRSQQDGESSSSARFGPPPPSENSESVPLEPTRQIVTTEPSTRGEGAALYASPPFNTHQFFKVLERVFPPEVARSLMRATRALLVDRLGRIRREGLNDKDLDNVCASNVSIAILLDIFFFSKRTYFVRLFLSCGQR